jgi:hypothetical protein
MSTERTPWRRLGVLLVESGVISQAELESALAEQSASGKRLGEILIARGYSSRPAIQDALAEQSGVMFEPERGFGTGLRGLLARKHHQRRSESKGKIARPQLAVVTALPQAKVAAVGAAPPEPRSPGVNLLRRAEPVARPPKPAEPKSQLVVQAELEALRTSQARQGEELGRIAEALSRVQAELAELRSEATPAPDPPVVAEPLRTAPMEEPVAPAEREDDAAHLCFVLEGSIYALREQDGPAPTAGSRVELDGTRYRVLKVARSPLPADERRCAYLLPE